MRWVLAWSLLAAFVGCSSSGGTETDNPAALLQDFTSSGCKSRDAADSATALTLASDLAGLECVEWAVAGPGELRILLHNLTQPCAKGYLGSATLGGPRALDLVVQQTTCDTFRCASCAYDFDYRLSGVTTDAPISLRLGWARCESQPVTTWQDSLTLPLDEEPTGIVCKRGGRLTVFDYSSTHGTCGERNMPCGDCDADRATCSAGLVCTELGADDARCLQTCETTEDCVANLRCDDGLCRAAASF